MLQPPAPLTVVMIAYSRANLLDVTGPVQAFSDARRPDGTPAYRVVVASENGGPVPTGAGVEISTVPLVEVMKEPVDTMLVAGGDPSMPVEATASLRALMVPFLDRPRRIGSICVGAFLLAELGVLDGREATTHWAQCSKLQTEYPAITVKPDSIFITAGRVWSSAGVSAGIDMALAMIEEDLGHEAALTLARELVLFLKRPGGQSQFSVELQRQMRDVRGRFDDLHSWMRSNLDQDLSVPSLAAAANMSPRNFARVYLRETGASPARAVEQLRVEAARRMLETIPDTIQRIAYRVGFGDDERMRRSFLKFFGVSPQDYRARFGASALPRPETELVN